MKDNFNDDLDILKDLDDLMFEDNNFEYSEEENDVELKEKDRKGRKPILKTMKEIGKYTSEDLKNKKIGDHARVALENIISTDSRSALNEITNMTNSIRDEFLKSLDPVKSELNDLMDNIKDKVPKKGKIKNIFDFIHKKVKKDTVDSFSSSFDELNYMLEDINGKLDYTKEKEESEIEYKKNDLDYKKSSTISLANINANIKINNEYLKIFNKKSLELQFKIYTILKDTLSVSKAQHSEILKQNEAMIKNTGLPEYVKIKTSERMGQALGNKLASNISESLFGGESPIKLMTDNIVANTTSKVQGFLTQLVQANMGLGMTKGQNVDKNMVAGSALADGIMKGFYWLTGKGIGKDKQNKVENAIQAFASDPEAFLRDKIKSDPKGLIGKIANKALRTTLDLATTHNKFKEINLETRSLKDQAIFDGETHRSINMVIPKLLAKIHNELQGIRTGSFETNKELRFDHDTLSLITTKESKDKIDKTIQTEMFDRTKKNIINISKVVKEKMEGVSFYGKELILNHLDNAILAFITENGRIHPTDLTKKEFIQYFPPNVQKKVFAAFTVFQDLLENDPDKSIVYRTFSSSLTAIRTSPALLDKYANGMNADLMLKDGYYAMDIYGGKIKADVAGINKKMYKRSRVKKHKTDMSSPYKDYDNTRIGLSTLKDDIMDDIKKFKTPKSSQSFMDLDSDSKGNVIYNKEGYDFVINKALYDNNDIMENIGFKIRFDFELRELVEKYNNPNTKKDDKKEILSKIETILEKYDNERINKIEGNKFIRAGKKFVGQKSKTKKLTKEWVDRITKGETLESIFDYKKLTNQETLKMYDMKYAPNSFSKAEPRSRVFDTKKVSTVKRKAPKPIQQANITPIQIHASKRESKTDSGDSPSFSSIKVEEAEKKIEKDLSTVIKTKKTQDMLKAINSTDLTVYFSPKNVEKVEEALNASTEEVEKFLNKKYKVSGKEIFNYESGKLLYVIDKVKSIKPEMDIESFNLSDKTTKFETENKVSEPKQKSVIKEKVEEINKTVQNLKDRFADEWIQDIEKQIVAKSKQMANKAKKIKNEDIVDKVFSLRQKITDFLNPVNILYQGSKFLFSLPRHYKNFFFSDFAKNMRARERKVIGKLFKGVAKSPFTIAKGMGMGLGAIGKGAWHGLRGYGEFYNSDFAKGARKLERKGIKKTAKAGGKILGKSILGTGKGIGKLGLGLLSLPLLAGKGIANKVFGLNKDREEQVGRDRKNGWRERLRKLDEEKKQKQDKKAEHVKNDPKDSWLMKLLKPAMMIIPVALGKIMGWGKKFLGPLWKGVKWIVPGIWKGIKWLGKGFGSTIWGGLKWLGRTLMGLMGLGGGMDLPGGGGKNKKPKKRPKGKKPRKPKAPKGRGKWGKILGTTALAAGTTYAVVGGGAHLAGPYVEEHVKNKRKNKNEEDYFDSNPYDDEYDDSSNPYDSFNTEREVEPKINIDKDLKDLESKYDLVNSGKVKDEIIKETYKEKVKVKNDKYLSKEEAEKKIDDINEFNRKSDEFDLRFKKNKMSMYDWTKVMYSYRINDEPFEPELANSLMSQIDIKNDADVAYIVQRYINIMKHKYPDFVNTQSYRILMEGYQELPLKARQEAGKDILDRIKGYEEELDRRQKQINSIMKKTEEPEYITKEVTKTRNVKKSNDGSKLRPELYQKLIKIMVQNEELKKDIEYFTKNKNLNRPKIGLETKEEIVKSKLDAKGPYTVEDLETNIVNQTKYGEVLQKKLESLIKDEENKKAKAIEQKAKKSPTESSNDFNSEMEYENDEEYDEDEEEEGIVDKTLDMVDTAYTVKMGVDAGKWAKNKIANKVPQSVTNATKNVTKSTAEIAKTVASKTASSVTSAANAGSKAAGAAVKTADVVAKSGFKVKDIAKKVIDILKSFKSRAIKKLGQRAGLKLGLRIGAKIASRLVPFLGWGLLLVDAGFIIKYMVVDKMSLASAVSMQLLGFDIMDDNSVALDEDGNPIPPDEENPNAEKDQKEYYAQAEKIKQKEDKKAKEIQEKIENQNKVDEKTANAFNSEINRKRKKGIIKNELRNRLGLQTKDDTSEYEAKYGESGSSYGYGETPDFAKTKLSESDLEDEELMKSFFDFKHKDGAKKFVKLDPKFKEQLIGFAKDMYSSTGFKPLINESFRTVRDQANIKGTGKKALPGNSTHNYGLSVDISSGLPAKGSFTPINQSPQQQAFTTAIERFGAKWGLHRPLKHWAASPEPWHVEPVWANLKVEDPLTQQTKPLRRVMNAELRERLNINDNTAVETMGKIRDGNAKEKIEDIKIAEFNPNLKQNNYKSTMNTEEVKRQPNTTPPRVEKNNFAVNEVKPQVLNEEIKAETKGDYIAQNNNVNNDTLNKSVAINEKQLTAQEKQIMLLEELLNMQKEQMANMKKEKQDEKMVSSRIQNKDRDTQIINSLEENGKYGDIPQELKTPRPGQAFNLARR